MIDETLSHEIMDWPRFLFGYKIHFLMLINFGKLSAGGEVKTGMNIYVLQGKSKKLLFTIKYNMNC